MLDHMQLDALAVQAQNGCVNSLWALKLYFQSYIHDLSDRNWWKISSEERFESSCFSRIEEAVRKYDPEKGTFAGQVYFRLRRLLFQHIKRCPPLSESLHETDSGKDEEKISDIPDDLAVVDGDLLAKDKIARLAAGDPRKLAILSAWTYDMSTDSEAALLLAQQFGGKAESHRKYIARFRTACREALTNAS